MLTTSEQFGFTPGCASKLEMTVPEEAPAVCLPVDLAILDAIDDLGILLVGSSAEWFDHAPPE